MTQLLPNEKSFSRRFFLYFLVIWIVFGLFKLYFTEMSGEEAYYWLFSQHLAWGYLDHPPMIGFVTSIGYWLFPNNLGVRLAMLVGNVLTIIILRKTLAVKDDKLYVWILLGMLPMYAGSLFLKTDVPLLLFESMFFFFYQRYLKADNIKNAMFIALSIALMLLSKHMGILVVMFTVVSNVKLLSKKSFWLIVGMTVLLMLPHTFWMIQNEFATVKFHARNRIDLGFEIKNILYYLGFQPIFFAPFTGVLLFAACFKFRIDSDFNRALKFTIVGVLIFFLVSTFKVEFHKHWTGMLSVPLILLSHEFLSSRSKMRLWVIRLSKIAVVFGVLSGVYLMYDFLPKSLTKDWDVLHNWDSWAEEVNTLSGGLPVVFINHYERAARYSYLTKEPALSYNTFNYRETQHDFWSLEDDLQGKRVFMIDRHNFDLLYPTYLTKIGKGIHYRIEENFRSFRKVSIELKGKPRIEATAGEVLVLELDITNNYDYDVDFSDVNGREVYLKSHLLVEQQQKIESTFQILTIQLKAGESIQKTLSVTMPDKAGKYDLRFSIQVEGIEAPINSRKYLVIVR